MTTGGLSQQCPSARCYYCDRTVIVAVPLHGAKLQAFHRNLLTCGRPSCIDMPTWSGPWDLLRRRAKRQWLVRNGGRDRP